jgi:tetratricopeptide (TPR) repeat protein
VKNSGNPVLDELIDRLTANPSSELLDKLGALLRMERAAPSPAATRVFSSAYAALARVPPEVTCAGRVVALLCIATHHYAVEAQPEGGLAPAVDAVATARVLGDAEWLCKALKIHGVLLADTGNIPESISAYAEALDLARQTENPRQECDLWVNIGIAYQYSQHFADAVACYERAIALAGDDPALQAASQLALSNLANAALESGETSKGLASIARASPTC